MRLRALVAALLVCVSGLILASDYRLHLPASARDALGAKGLFVHDGKGVLKDGDWIMDVSFAPAPAGATKVRVAWSDEKSSKPLLAPQGGAKGFAGRIHKSPESLGGPSIEGYLVFVSGSVPSTTQKDLIAVAKKKATNLPWLLIISGTLGVVGLSSLWIAKRRRQGPAPLAGRRLYEENIREVHGFLERIIESQRKLVKNPPVIRSFRKDIDGFRDRLTALEDSSRQLEAKSSEIIATLGNIEKVVRTISAVESRLSREIASSNQQIEKKHSEIELKVDSIQAALPKMDKATDAIHKEVLAQASKFTIDIHSLSEAVKAGFVGDALRAEEQREIVEAVRTQVEKLKNEVGPIFTAQQAHAKSLADLSATVQSSLEKASATVQANLDKTSASLQSSLDKTASELRANLDKAVQGVDKKLEEEAKRAATAEAAHSTKAAELASRVEALSKSLESVNNSVSKEGELQKATLAALELALAEARAEANTTSTNASEKLELLATQFAGLSSSHGEQITTLATTLGTVREGIDASMAQAIKKIDEVIAKSSTEAAKRLDGLTEVVAEVRQNASSLAKELSAARTDHGALTKSLEKQSAQADSAVTKLSEKLLSIEKQAEGLAHSLAEQSKRLTAFENLDRAVSALQEDLRNLSSIEGQKKDASVDGVEVTKKLASTQSLRLEQISQEVRGVQDAIKPLNAMAEVMASLQARIDEVSSRPVPAPVESVSPESFERLSSAVESIQSSLKDLAKLPSEVDQKLASIAIGGNDSDQSSEALAALSQVAASVESLRSQLSSTAGVSEAVQKLAEQIAANEIKSEERLQSLQSRVDAQASTAESTVASLMAELGVAQAEARSKSEAADAATRAEAAARADAAAKAEIAARAEAAAKAEAAAREAAESKTEEAVIARKKAEEAQSKAQKAPELVVVDGGQDEEEDTVVDLTAPIVLRVEKSEAEEEETAAPAKPHKASAHTHDEETHRVSSQAVHLPGRKMPWALAGGSAGRSYMVESSFELGPPIDTIEAKVATATPDPAFPVSSLVFTGDELAYVHGENLKTFWPGQGEKSFDLEGSASPSDHRLLWWDDHLFVAKDSSVDVYDLENWSKTTSFEGSYLDQTSTLFHWVGIQSMNGLLAIDFRNLKGKRIGQPRITNASALEPFQTATAANAVYLASEDGRIFRATDQGVEAVGQLEGSLLTISSYGANLVALSKTKTGVKAHLQQVGDKPRKTIEAQSDDVLAQGVVMGDRYYYIDKSGSTIKVLNVPKFKIADSFPMEGLDRCVGFIGISHASHHWLAVALAPSESGKGVIKLVNPDTGETRDIATVGHPHVRMVFAHGHLAVLSGSAYQNILRIFDPFKVAKHSLKSAA